MLSAECVYGEGLALRAVERAGLSVAFTRARLVRVRRDLHVPDVDQALTLETTPDWEGIVRGGGGDAGWVGRDGLDDGLDEPDVLPG